MVSGHTFVESERGQRVLGSNRWLESVDVERAGPRAVGRALVVERGRRVTLSVFLNGLDDDAGGRETPKCTRQRGLRLPEQLLRDLDQLFSTGWQIARIVGELFGEGADR